jgi:hypothetical protein
MVGRDKRSVYEPDVLNVMDWDDAKEFLDTVARDTGTMEEELDPKFLNFMNTTMGDRQDDKPKQYDPNTTMTLDNMPSYRHAFKFGMDVIKKMDPDTKKHFAKERDDALIIYMLDIAKKTGVVPKYFVEEDLDEVTQWFDEIFHDPEMAEWSWADLLRSNIQDQGIAESNEGTGGRAEMTKMVVEKLKSFYNISNEGVAPFRAPDNIATDIKKDVEEKFGEQAGEHAREMALAFMEKKNDEWQVANGHGDDGLARLKELLGNIKSKVEGIGDQGQGGRDFNKNIMPAEDQAEAYNPNSAAAEHARELKAHQRKDLETKAKSGDESAKKRLQALNDKEERMRNDYNARMERESIEMESIIRLAGLAK